MNSVDGQVVTAAPHPSSPPDRRQARPRRSFQRRIVLWTLGLVVAATLLSAVWLSKIAQQALAESHIRTCELLAQTLAGSLAGRVDAKGSLASSQVIASLMLDPRVAFIAVSDPDSRTIFQKTIDPQAYAGFAKVALAFDGKYIEPAAPIYLPDGSLVVARKVPIWQQAHRKSSSNNSPHHHAARQLEGFVVLAMRDRSSHSVLMRMQLAQLGAAGLICLFTLPVVMWTAKRWTAPLMLLVDATAKLARGEKPSVIQHHSDDELGLLANRFNGMSNHLFTARAELEQANAQLEEKVRLRTAELERLNNRLQSDIRDKDEFVRVVSHDLGAPLRNITGMTDLLIRKHADDLTEDALRKLERITLNAKHQTSLINDLLELSRIRACAKEKQMVETEPMIKELASHLSFDLEEKGIELCVESPLPVVFVERNRLYQVFQNLIDNAIKYMSDDGEKRITIRAEQSEIDVTFFVADTGRGIDPDDIDMVFQVFRRATHGNIHDIPGRGVGLANVKSIIQTHGGNIHVESTPEMGSTFIFTLPKTAN